MAIRRQPNSRSGGVIRSHAPLPARWSIRCISSRAAFWRLRATQGADRCGREMREGTWNSDSEVARAQEATEREQDVDTACGSIIIIIIAAWNSNAWSAQ